MGIRDFISKYSKEACLAPVVASLFLMPIFWNPLLSYSFTQGKELLFKFIMSGAMLSLSFIVIYKRNYSFRNILESPLFFLLFLQISISTLTNALSSTPLAAIYGTYSRGFGFIIELFLFTFAVYCSLTLSEKRILKLLKIVFLSGFLTALYGIFQRIGFDPFFSNYDIKIFAGRVFSFLGNPSYLGQFLLLNVIIGGFLAVSGRTKSSKILYISGTLILISAIFLSQTRTAIFGLLFAVMILVMKYFKSIITFFRRYKLALIGWIILIGTVFALLPQERYSFSKLAFRSLNARFEIWRGTIDLIKEKPFFGYGGETFYIYFPEIVTKKFLSLEEDINLSADRIHNETLEIFFSHGVFAVIIYLLLIACLFGMFFKSQNKTAVLLSLVIIANSVQNQFAFPDISISVLIAFCFGGLIAFDLRYRDKINIRLNKQAVYLIAPSILFFVLYIGFFTIYKPYMSQLAYAESRKNYTVDYAIAVNKHKEALTYTPYFSELWYELMFIDPSSMKRALFNLEKIEGESGNVLAWKGNFYADKDPQTASTYYRKALEKNPNHPNWIRAYADMLYEHKDYENALFLYNKYLENIPDFWKWTDELKSRSKKEQKTYETFLKHTPYFWEIIEKIEHIIAIVENK